MTSSKNLHFYPLPLRHRLSSRLNHLSEQKWRHHGLTTSNFHFSDLCCLWLILMWLQITEREGLNGLIFYYVRYERSRSLICFSSLIARSWKFMIDIFFEILIHFNPNLVVKLAKISPKIVVKNDVIFGKPPSSVISRHNLKTPSPLADDVICERPLNSA